MSNMIISINSGQHRFLFDQKTGILQNDHRKYQLIGSVDWNYKQIRNALKYHIVPLMSLSSPIADMLFKEYQAVEVLNV